MSYFILPTLLSARFNVSFTVLITSARTERNNFCYFVFFGEVTKFASSYLG